MTLTGGEGGRWVTKRSRKNEDTGQHNQYKHRLERTGLKRKRILCQRTKKKNKGITAHLRTKKGGNVKRVKRPGVEDPQKRVRAGCKEKKWPTEKRTGKFEGKLRIAEERRLHIQKTKKRRESQKKTGVKKNRGKRHYRVEDNQRALCEKRKGNRFCS